MLFVEPVAVEIRDACAIAQSLLHAKKGLRQKNELQTKEKVAVNLFGPVASVDVRGVSSDRVPGHMFEDCSCEKQKILFVLVVATL